MSRAVVDDRARDLLQRHSQGDGTVLGELLQRYLPGLRAFIRLRMDSALRARESCSDLAQSVCAEVIEGAERFDYRGEASFKAWLYTTALSKIRDKHRHHTAQRRDVRRVADLALDESSERGLAAAYSSVLTASRQAMAKEELELLEAAFDRLPEDYREVITLSRIAGLSNAEIAVNMERSETSVRGLLYRALVRLGALLSAVEPPESG